MRALVMLTLKVENMKNTEEEKNKMLIYIAITGICRMCVGCKVTIVNYIT